MLYYIRKPMLCGLRHYSESHDTYNHMQTSCSRLLVWEGGVVQWKGNTPLYSLLKLY